MKKVAIFLLITVTLFTISCTKQKISDIQSPTTVDESKAKMSEKYDFVFKCNDPVAKRILDNGEWEIDLPFSMTKLVNKIDSIRIVDVDAKQILATLPVTGNSLSVLLRTYKKMRTAGYDFTAEAIDKQGRLLNKQTWQLIVWTLKPPTS